MSAGGEAASLPARPEHDEERPISAPSSVGPHGQVPLFLTGNKAERPSSAGESPSRAIPVDAEEEPLMDAFDGLEIMTHEAIKMFQEGHQQEALQMAVQFALAARNELGHTNPIHINSLATVAALVDQMGGSAEADALLFEAEDLQDEMEMEALGIDLYEPDSNDDDNEEVSDEINSRPPTGLSDASGSRPSRERVSASRGSQHRSSTTTGGSSGSPDIEGYSDEWSDTGGSNEDDGDVDLDSDELLERGARDIEEEEGEAEAEAITRLTLEVNTLLSQECPEEAAQLLSEAESILAAGGADVSDLGKAALHTLWAAVLGAVGEDEKAERLYSEAMSVLKDVSRGPAPDSSDSEVEDGESSDMEDEEEEEDVEDEKDECVSDGDVLQQDIGSKGSTQSCPPTVDKHADAAVDPALPEMQQEPVKIPDLPPITSASPSLQVGGSSSSSGSPAPKTPSPEVAEPPAIPSSSVTANDIRAAKERAAKMRESMQHDIVQVDSTAALAMPPPVPPETTAKEKPDAVDVPSSAASAVLPVPSPTATSAAPEARLPTPPLTSSPKKRRPVPLAPHATPKASPKPAPRCGGGFVAPKASAVKPKAKTKPKAKAKENTEEAVSEPVTEEAPVAIAESAPEEPALPEEPPKPPTPEEQREQVERAVIHADHYLGMMKFDKAADKLEEQLVLLEEENHAHRHSELHIDVMMKYGGVLWWAEDPESAVDAFTAAEQMLIEKPASNWQSKRRTEVWQQAAQVCRGCGDLQSAEEQLRHAVFFLTGLLKSDPTSRDFRDSLREAQAQLAQVCVELGEFDRAEGLYMEAFMPQDGDEQPPSLEELAEQCREEDRAAADKFAEIGRPELAAMPCGLAS